MDLIRKIQSRPAEYRITDVGEVVLLSLVDVKKGKT